MTDSTQKMIKGVTLNLGGENYVVPPLNVDQLEEFTKQIELLEGPSALPQGDDERPADYAQRAAQALKDWVKTQRAALVTLTQAALSRNYPEMTEARVKEILDLGNLAAVSAAIMGSSGLVAAGEMQPGE